MSGWDAEDYPQSVKSGRTNDEVKANAPAIWVSAAPASTAEIDLSAARDAPMPRYLEPMKATLATKAFRDEDWLYELKWDGYRVEAVVRDGKTQLFTRNGNDAEAYFPKLLNAAHLDRRPRGDRGRRGRRPRRARPSRLLAAPGADQRGPDGPAGAAGLPGLRPPLPRRPVAGRRPARVAQAAARARDPAHEPRAVRQADRDRGPRVLRGGQGAGPGGDRREAPPVPLRARSPRLVVAEDQGPARAGAGGRRLDARGGEREGRWARSSSASTRTSKLRFAGKVGLRVRCTDAQGAAGAARRRSRRSAAVRPAARRRTIAAGGAATSPASAGSGRSS